MADAGRKRIHRCRCRVCRSRSDSESVAYHRAIHRVMAELDERSRRLFAGLLARQGGHGGIQQVAEITGLSRITIRRGLRESERGQAESSSRVRRRGGGRKCVEKNSSCAGLVEGIVAGCNGWQSDGRSAMDPQDHAQVGRCIAATRRAGEPCDGGPSAAGAEVLVAIEPQAAGWEERPVLRPAVPPVGASASAISAARLAHNQRGHEEKGVGGQLHEWRACLAM
jgi:DNA-binding phage protein